MKENNSIETEKKIDAESDVHKDGGRQNSISRWETEEGPEENLRYLVMHAEGKCCE